MRSAGPSMADTALVLDPASLPFRERSAGVSTIHLATAARGATGLLNGITRIAPGAAVPEHFHNCEESVLILSGRAYAVIDGVTFAMDERHITLIPTGIPHYLANPSADAPLLIFWTYASIDATRTIVATGRTTRIDEELGPPD